MGGCPPPSPGSAGAVTGGSVQIHPAALEEAEAAVDWYRQRSMRAAEMFLRELDRAIDTIGQHPEQYSTYEFGTRGMILRRFPYLLVFRETAVGSKSLQWLTGAVALAIRGIGFTDASAFVGSNPSRGPEIPADQR